MHVSSSPNQTWFTHHDYILSLKNCPLFMLPGITKTSFIITCLLCSIVLTTNAQNSRFQLNKPDDSDSSAELSIGANIDVYYGFSTLTPRRGYVPYLVSSNRHDEAIVNLACIDIQYKNERVRARLVPGFGTYMNANYNAEMPLMRNMIEASIGFKPFSDKQIWLDAGVIGSPYTNENAFSREQLMYTRSLASELSPYYLSGLKLSFPAGKRLNLYGYLINGWQIISDYNDKKSFGSQVEFRPNSKNLINWNTYIGDERSPITPDWRMRYFSDIYWNYNVDGDWSITTCFYAGIQTTKHNSHWNKDNIWWQGNLISRYRFNKKHSLSGRIEYFSDANDIVASPLSNLYFETFSGGICYNFQISKEMMFRLEGRQFMSRADLFVHQNTSYFSNTHTWIISNLSIGF